jgi:ABC-type multidrug transport system permease subunit
VIFNKERAAGMYSTIPWSAAHVVVEAPFIMLLAVVCSVICYYSLGLNGEDGRFGYFVLDLFMSLMVAESLMVVIAALAPVAIVGIAAGAMIYGGFMMVQVRHFFYCIF